MHIYAFGSICRGEVNLDSDVDLLAVVEGQDGRLDPALFSIYSYRRIREIWLEGNPFAWHLSLEAKLLYSFDGRDHLEQLGPPSTYRQYFKDCCRFFRLFEEARKSIEIKNKCLVFDLSTVFLSIRNFSSCYSLGVGGAPDFSRHAALRLNEDSIPIDERAYHIFERARILCTRGHGEAITPAESDFALESLCEVGEWMAKLIEKVSNNERLQQQNCGTTHAASTNKRGTLAQ
jgi:Nucleotidyltransferase domain